MRSELGIFFPDLTKKKPDPKGPGSSKVIVFMFLVYDIVCNVFSDNLPPIYSFFAKINVTLLQGSPQ